MPGVAALDVRSIKKSGEPESGIRLALRRRLD
jgi:hypothetical protein